MQTRSKLFTGTITKYRYNTENGGPALEKLTNAIHAGTEKIKQYYIADEDLSINYSKTGTTQYLVQTRGSSKFRPFTVQVDVFSMAGLLPGPFRNKQYMCMAVPTPLVHDALQRV